MTDFELRVTWLARVQNDAALEELRRVLEAGGYNAKPSKLRQGSISAVFYDENGNERHGTEEEWDKLRAHAERESRKWRKQRRAEAEATTKTRDQ